MTATTYTQWKVGDKINICGSVTEFCGTEYQFIITKDINVTKSPTDCFLDFGTGGSCGLHINNIELTFSIVKGSPTSNCVVAQTYNTLGSVRTNSDGAAGLSYTITEQDRLNYISATNEGYFYYVMFCITNGDGQSVSTSRSKKTNGITIDQSHLECVSGVCTQVTGAGTNTCNTPGSVTECLTTGSINCTSTPSGAQIWLDGNNTGQVTPYTLTNISAEMHGITYILAGYNNCGVNVTVTAGDTVSADCTLDETLPSFYMKSYTFNYSVPSFYPTWYINGALYVLNGTGGLADKISSVINPDEFEFTSITFDEQSRLIKILVTNKTVPLSLNTSEHTTKSMAFFAVILIPAILDALVALGIGTLIATGLYVIWSHLVGESVGTTPSTIQYNVTPLICSGTSSLPMDDEVTINYRCGEAAEKIEKIPAGESFPITCESEVLELNINATSKKYGAAVIKVTQKNKNPILCFENKGQGTYDLTANKCTYYVITQQLTEGLSTKIIKALDGILPTTVNAGEVCITPMPCDLENFVPPVIPCDKIGKGETKTINVTYESCIVAKNRIYLSTLFIPSGLTKQDAIGFIPDKVKLMNGATVVQEKVPTSSATIFEHVDVDIDYKVVIESADYVQPTDMIVKFSYDSTKPETLCGNFADETIYANPLNTSYSITFDVKDSVTTLPIINATIILNGDRVKTYKTNLSGQLSLYLQKVTNTPHKIEIEATGYKAISFNYSPTLNEIVYKTLDSAVTQALYDSRILDVKPSTTINAGGIIKFTGKIEGYKDNTWNNLSGAIVYVKITDVSDKELRTFTTTSSVFGNFETGEWLIPKDLSNKEINVIATFDATGDYKTATPFSTSYVIGEGCCLSLPLIGCVATQSTCNALKTGAYIVGGLLIGYIGFKVYKSLKSK